MNNEEHSDRHRRQVSAGSHRALWGHEKNFPSSSREQAKPVKDLQAGKSYNAICLLIFKSLWLPYELWMAKEHRWKRGDPSGATTAFQEGMEVA